MKEKASKRSDWKKVGIILSALVGGFLLSFIGFGLLWSGISWYFQMLMLFPFLLLTWIVSRWNQGMIDSCICILCGAAPLGTLITQFRDTNDSHLMPILIVLCWLIGIASGYFLAKVSVNSTPASSEDITPS